MCAYCFPPVKQKNPKQADDKAVIRPETFSNKNKDFTICHAFGVWFLPYIFGL